MNKIFRQIKNFTILERLMVMLLTITILSSACYMYFGYQRNSDAMLSGIDSRLELAALTAHQLIPPDFFEHCETYTPMHIDQLTAPGAPAGVASFFADLKTLSTNAKLDSTYAVMQRADGTYFFPFGTIAGCNINYRDPAQDIVDTLQDGITRKTTLTDPEFGTARSYIRRCETTDGRFYVIGADALMSEVHLANYNAFMTFLYISAGSFVLALFIGMYFSRKLSLPIQKLSQFTIELKESGFAHEKPMPPELLPDVNGKSRFEIEQLALNIDLFRHALQTTTAQKERAESELRIAGEIQYNFLPHHLDSIVNFDIFGNLTPALEAGGDLYDFMVLDDERIYFAIGDVCGKGMPAALFMAMALTLLRAGLRQKLPLPELLKFVNNNLSANNENCTFVTLLCGIFDKKQNLITYCNAGSCPPLIRYPDGRIEYEKMPKRPPVGIMKNASYLPIEINFLPGSTMVLYTDGITEAEGNERKFFGIEALKSSLGATSANLNAKAVYESIFNDVANFSHGCSQSDDITLLVLQN